MKRCAIYGSPHGNFTNYEAYSWVGYLQALIMAFKVNLITNFKQNRICFVPVLKIKLV